MCNLSALEICARLQNPSAWESPLIFPSLPSTNTLAKEMAETGAPHGTLLLAEEQTAGRGRLGRSFFSPAGSGIYLSMILRPSLPLSDTVRLTAAAAVAVCRAITEVTGLEPHIKWVNDIFLWGKKLCGILTETAIDPNTQTLRYAVVGIGINVTAAAYPEELKPLVTALSEHTSPPDRNELVASLLNHFEAILPDLTAGTFMAEYKCRSNLLHQPVLVLQGNRRQPATVRDITPDGALLVEWEDGSLEAIASGEVSIRINEERIKL